MWEFLFMLCVACYQVHMHKTDLGVIR